jgi:hypothetical protein
MKSANKLYRESGSKLSFKDWLNKDLNPKKEDTKTDEFVGNIKVFNIKLTYIIVGVVVIVGGIVAYRYFRKNK